jgi:hypothetical protein
MTSPCFADDSERRSAQYRAYATLALEHLDQGNPRLAWLFPPGKSPRQKVLEELGRIAVLDQDLCHPMAVGVSRSSRPQPTPAPRGSAANGSTTNERCGDPTLLRRSILRAINGFQSEHPGTTSPPSSTPSEVTPTSGKPNGAGNRRLLDRDRGHRSERSCQSGVTPQAAAIRKPKTLTDP